MTETTEMPGIGCKDDSEYKDQSKGIFPPMAIAIAIMLLYFSFLLIKYPL